MTSLPLIDWILHGITNRIYPDPDPSVSHFHPQIGFQNPRLPFPRKKNSLEHARILSEGFQNPGICFQNPRLQFFQKKKTALSTPEFYRRASRTRYCHFFRKKSSLEHARILSEDFQIPYFAEISYFHLCNPCPDHNITKYPIFEYIP